MTFATREQCIFCDCNVQNVLQQDIKKIPQSICMTDEPQDDIEWMPYNIQKCRQCGCYQNKYLADLNILYNISHIAPVGSTRSHMTDIFCDMILSNPRNLKMVEVGAGNGVLLQSIFTKKPEIQYTVIDPSYTGPEIEGLSVKRTFLENVNLQQVNADVMIMSHVFEHFYNPVTILKQIQQAPTITRIYLCHPNYDSYISKEPLTYNCLHCEHTFFVSNQQLVQLLQLHGFKLKALQTTDYAILLELERFPEQSPSPNIPLVYPPPLTATVENFITKIQQRVSYLNEAINLCPTPIYLWPCSIHSIMLFMFGLDYTKLTGILDNAPSKNDKYVYGYNIKCRGLSDVVQRAKNDKRHVTIILNGGVFSKEVKNSIQNDYIRVME